MRRFAPSGLLVEPGGGVRGHARAPTGACQRSPTPFFRGFPFWSMRALQQGRSHETTAPVFEGSQRAPDGVLMEFSGDPIGPQWLSSGFLTVFSWIPHLDLLWICSGHRIPLGLRLGSRRIPEAFLIVSLLWAPHGFPMDFLRIPYGFCTTSQ